MTEFLFPKHIQTSIIKKVKIFNSVYKLISQAKKEFQFSRKIINKTLTLFNFQYLTFNL